METQSTVFTAAEIRQFSPVHVLLWGWFLFVSLFCKRREKKTRNHNPNPALARPAPFEERRFPRATLKPGGLILLPGMSVQIQSGSADCWGGGGGV